MGNKPAKVSSCINLFDFVSPYGFECLLNQVARETAAVKSGLGTRVQTVSSLHGERVISLLRFETYVSSRSPNLNLGHHITTEPGDIIHGCMLVQRYPLLPILEEWHC